MDTTLATRCLTFELDIDTDFRTVSQRQPTEVHAQVRIPLRPDPTLRTWNGTASINYLNITEPYSDGGCTYHATGSGSWTVFGMQIAAGAVDRSVAGDHAGAAAVRHPASAACARELHRHLPQRRLVLQRLAHTQPTMAGRPLRRAEPQGADYTLENWSLAAGDVFGTKSYSRTYQTAGVTWAETTTMQLKHTPS